MVSGRIRSVRLTRRPSVGAAYAFFLPGSSPAGGKSPFFRRMFCFLLDFFAYEVYIIQFICFLVYGKPNDEQPGNTREEAE